MTMHYHGTPITPTPLLYEIAGRCFCVSHAQPQQVRVIHEIGQSVLLDNGAFSAWIAGRPTDWPTYYAWSDLWLIYRTTWAIIPDVIDGPEDQQDVLISQWPHGDRGAPVWHMNEDIGRLLRLLERWPRVCIGSTAQYRVVMSESWQRRMDAIWDSIAAVFGKTPWVHMLRGMQCAGEHWPFSSLDSTDIARNHNRPQNTTRKMAERWDALQCPATWSTTNEQTEMF
jgi:hypothetical protein